MKRNTPRPKPQPPTFGEKFETYIDRCGALLDEYHVPRELVEKLAALDVDIRNEIEDDTMDADYVMEAMKQDEGLRDDLLYNMSGWCGKPSLGVAQDLLPAGYQVVLIQNLNEEMLFDRFEAHLTRMRNAGVASI